MSSKKLLKIALFGAVTAVVIDNVLKPSISKSIGL